MHAREDFHKAVRRGVGSRFVAVALLVVLGGCAGADEDRVPEGSGTLLAESDRQAMVGPPAGHAWVIFGPDTVVAEVAASAEERAEGLMYRDAVPDGTGMLFVFPDNRVRSFWMANTYVPLDIAYMDPSYRIVDIVQMEPLVTDTYPSSAPAMFALEVRQGWFAEKGIPEGSQAEIVFGVGGPR
jgi:uncharacterized membrane protein (UPF0127 family)